MGFCFFWWVLFRRRLPWRNDTTTVGVDGVENKNSFNKNKHGVMNSLWKPKRTSWECEVTSTLQGINISYLGKRKIIFKSAFLWDMLVPRTVNLPQLVCLGFAQKDANSNGPGCYSPCVSSSPPINRPSSPLGTKVPSWRMGFFSETFLKVRFLGEWCAGYLGVHRIHVWYIYLYLVVFNDIIW